MIRGLYGELLLTRKELLERGPNEEETYKNDTEVIFHQLGGRNYPATVESVPLGVNFFIPGDPQVYSLIPNNT